MSAVKTAGAANTAPRRLLDAEPARVMSREACEALFKRVVALAAGGGETAVTIDAWWEGNLRWARNRATTAGDSTDHGVRITRIIRGARSDISTNKFDDASLTLALRSAEKTLRYYTENPDNSPMPPAQTYLQPKLWSEATYNLTAAERSNTARAMTDPVVAKQLVAAGYLETDARVRAIFNTSGMNAYYAQTYGEYSVTVRNPQGTGSGWAGVTKQDWAAIDVKGLSAKALAKCVGSADPRAIEPGRYTLIMEPQAVRDFFESTVYALDRWSAENMQTVYTLSHGQSKIGMQIFDARITVSADPMDPDGGFIPFDYEGYPFRPVKWVENGVLKELSYSRQYALSTLGHGEALPNSYGFRMSGGTTSIDEMIASTERGLIVTRLSDVQTLDGVSLLSTGVSRDGLWLIEKGKIKFPVKNMRFTESPMFAFNNVLALGVPERVYGYYPAIVPPAKVRDFNFTSLSDAV